MFDLVLVFLIVVHLVLNYLSSFFFFQNHPFALGFYIRFDLHSFNCDIFGFESFIESICL